METRANFLLVGGFVLVFVVGLLGFVIWLAKFQFDTQVAHYDVVFKGSVTGLNVGGPVRYSGVKVGEVVAIRLEPKRPDQVRVTLEVMADTPVRQDTTASLEIQGLTGGLYVLLSGGSAGAAPMAPPPGKKRAEIPARRSSLEQVIAGAPELLDGANLLLARANRILNDDNAVQLSETLVNLNRFTGTLAEQSTHIEALFADATETMAHLRSASAAVDGLVSALEQESGALFSQAKATLASMETMADGLTGNAAGIENDIGLLITDLRKTAKTATAAAKQMEDLVEENRGPINEFTATGLVELTTLVAQARDLLVGLNRVTTEVERDPARFLFGNQQQGYEPNQ